jgi:hypothetical protein
MEYTKKIVFVKPPFNVERIAAVMREMGNYQLLVKRTLVDVSAEKVGLETLSSESVAGKVGDTLKTLAQLREFFGGETVVIDHIATQLRIDGKRLRPDHLVTQVSESKLGDAPLAFGEIDDKKHGLILVAQAVPPIIKMHLPINYRCMMGPLNDIVPLADGIKWWNMEGDPIRLDE